MGLLRGGNINSRSLGLLRARASKYNPLMGNGSSVSEGNSQAATDQYEDQNNTGGAAPTSPTDANGGGGGGTSGGTSTGGGSTVDPGPGAPKDPVPTCDTDAGYYLNSANQCVQMSTKGENATPWQTLVNICSAMVTTTTLLIVVGSILAYVGKRLLSSPNPVTVAIGVAMINAWYYMIIAALIAAAAIIAMGVAIDAMGGSPQGTMFMLSGGMLEAGAAVSWFYPQSSLMVTTIIPAILAICAKITAALGAGAG
jgi:hypothetical protein